MLALFSHRFYLGHKMAMVELCRKLSFARLLNVARVKCDSFREEMCSHVPKSFHDTGINWLNESATTVAGCLYFVLWFVCLCVRECRMIIELSMSFLLQKISSQMVGLTV